MRVLSTYLFFLTLVFSALDVTSQDILTSRKGSYYTLVYQLTNTEAFELYSGYKSTIPFEYFHTLIDSYPTDSVYRGELSPGHYLHIKSIGNNFQYTLESVDNVDINLLDNSRDLSMIFLDKDGKELRSLYPQIGKRKIPFNELSKTYKLSKTNRRGWLLVNHEQHTNIFRIERRYNNTLAARIKRRITRSFPIRHTISLFTYVGRNLKSLLKYGHAYPPGIYYRFKRMFDDKNYEGYVAVSKPIYKPGDTVRVKGYFMTRRGKAIDRDLNVVIRGGYPDNISKNLGVADKPWAGAYVFEFVLADTLKLMLDRSYTIYFNDKNYNNYPSKSFMYEQYELKRNSFSITTVPDIPADKPPVLLLNGKDPNGLPLYDININLSLRSKAIDDFYNEILFIKDTVFNYSQRLEPNGGTEITLPDSIFANAAVHYEATATFTNSENEYEEKTIPLFFDSKIVSIKSQFSNDSLLLSAQSVSAVDGRYLLKAFTSNHNLVNEKTVTLPHKEKIDPFINAIEILLEDKLVKEIRYLREEDGVEVMAQRSKDSLILSVINPRKLQFRYQLFRNNRIIDQGEDMRYHYAISTDARDRYYFSVQYIWAGQAEVKDYNLAYNTRQLNIDIDHPLTVFPGEEVPVVVNVRDAYDKPVAEVDLTAYSITKSFGEQKITVPSFQVSKSRKLFNTFELGLSGRKKIQSRLQFDLWRTRLGLDSISYYHFLYPEGGLYTNHYPVEDSITQIAPFVVKDGAIQHVQYIYFDKELKYLEGTQSIDPYSFVVGNYETDIKIRLNRHLITIPNVQPVLYEKLILSLDLDHMPDSVINVEMQSGLTPLEESSMTSHFMMVSRDYSQSRAFFRQGNHFYLLPKTGNHYGRGIEMVGPFYPGYVEFQSYFSRPFKFKPGMIYQFEPDLVDRESVKIDLLKNSHHSPRYSLSDEVWTESKIKELWKSQEGEGLNQFTRYSSNYDSSKILGQLVLKINHEQKRTLLCTFVLNLEVPDKYFIYPGTTVDLKELPPGLYVVAPIFKNESYIRSKPIQVIPFGRTFFDLTSGEIRPADIFSAGVIQKLRKWASNLNYAVIDHQKDMQDLRQYYYRQATREINYYGGRWVSGRVLSEEDGSPLPGVNIVVRGTSVGTITDLNGIYEIYVPTNAVLIFSFIGLQSQETNVGQRSVINATMALDVQQLSEVVVTAVGISTERMALGYSMTSLQGRIPGVSMSNSGVPDIKIRGLSSIAGMSNPLIIIDGALARSTEIDEKKITAIEILKSEEAIALYGARAANGVILISTRPGVNKTELLKTKFPGDDQLIVEVGEQSGSKIRKNFRDDAFWQPKLRTNEKGVAKFNATFPDDITAWDVYVLGMASRKRTGIGRSTLQSFKPLVAQLGVPAFLIRGDTAAVIGKVTNYTTDSLQLIKSISITDQSDFNGKIEMKNSIVDSITIVGIKDTVDIKYQVTYNNYVDGEIRKIPVFPVGTSESKGFFIALPEDTTFTLEFPPSTGLIRLFAQADLLDVLLNEIASLKVYPYECNEQLASKLKALLAEKSILEFKSEKFGNDRSVERAIRMLCDNQNNQGSWSWWGSSENGSLWITLHVAKALDMAEKIGYKVKYDRLGLLHYLRKIRTYTLEEELKVYLYLAQAGEKVTVSQIVDSIKVKNVERFNYLKLLTMRLRQLSLDSVDWKWIESQKHVTQKGNWHWGEPSNTQWNNDIDNTLIAYQLYEGRNADDPNLFRIRNYFLEKRGLSWTNTFQSSQIIEVLVPFLTGNESKRIAPSLQFEGDVNLNITKFPFETTIENARLLTISKKGTSPIYFTAYEKTWNQNPKEVSENFIINAKLVGNNDELMAGVPNTLTVTVEVKKDAEYVMINVPIPAGCTYDKRNQSWSNGEVHREYDVHETRIYCEKLKAGKYNYSIQLLPRFRGRYNLNPAKVEWMYFPTVFGRNSLQVTTIR